MKLILLESYEADLSNSGYNIQFGEELTEIQTNLYSVCKHSDTFLAHCILFHIISVCTSLYKTYDLATGTSIGSFLLISFPGTIRLPIA